MSSIYTFPLSNDTINNINSIIDSYYKKIQSLEEENKLILLNLTKLQKKKKDINIKCYELNNSLETNNFKISNATKIINNLETNKSKLLLSKIDNNIYDLDDLSKFESEMTEYFKNPKNLAKLEANPLNYNYEMNGIITKIDINI
jgi:hypothetical protein